MLGFLVHLYQAVEKGSDPEKPFQEGEAHDSAYDGGIDNLQVSAKWLLSILLEYLRP